MPTPLILLLAAQATVVSPVKVEAAAARPPVSAYGALPAMSQVRLSPDGTRIAYVAASGDDQAFVVKEVGGPILQTISTNRRLPDFVGFAGPDHVLMGIKGTEYVDADNGKTELHAILVYNLKTHRGEQVAPRFGVAANGPPIAVAETGGHAYGYFLGAAQSGADTGGMAHAANEGDLVGLYRVDLDNLSSSLVARGSAHVDDYAVTPEGEVMARVEEFDHGKSWRVLKGADGTQVLASGKTEWGSPEVHAFGRTRDTLVFKGTEDGEYDPPRELPLAGGEPGKPLIDGADASPLRDRLSGLTIGFRVGGFVQDAVFLDPAIDAKWQGVRAAFPDDVVDLTDYDRSFNRWIVYVTGPHDSGHYFLVDLEKAKAINLGGAYPQIRPDQVGASRWFDYTAADGTKLKGVLTLPPGRPAKALPLIMLPHGGPGNGSYDQPGFDWWAQAIASRGYAVFQPDFRGSGGLGRSFERAGWGQWGKLMESDVSDAIPALAAAGIVDPKRACIVGWSYGGYATLAGVTLQHGLYRCAVAGGAVADLNDMMTWVREHSGRLDPVTRYWDDAMALKGPGDPAGAAVSPLRHAREADVPIMIIHGRDDTVVPFRQGQMMTDALKAAGKTVEFVQLGGEDHHLSKAATRQQMLEAMDRWIETYNPPN